MARRFFFLGVIVSFLVHALSVFFLFVCLFLSFVSSASYAPCCFPFFRRSEIAERVDHFASGLEEEGMTPPNPDGMKLLGLFSKNRPEWVIAEQVRLG